LLYLKVLPSEFIGISLGLLAGMPVLLLAPHFIGYDKARNLPYSSLLLATFMWITMFVSSYVSMKPRNFIFSLGNATGMAIGAVIADLLFKALEMRKHRLAITLAILFAVYCFLIYPAILFLLHDLK
jgi:multisubunit Na+/H+ antiporter MnhE subunit